MIGALLATILVGTGQRTAIADPPPWQVTEVSPQDLRVHGDGSVTITNCSDYVPVTSGATSYAAVTYTATGSIVTKVPKQISEPYNTLTSHTCRQESAVGLDGSFFVRQTDSYGWERIAAYKNGAIRWTYTITRCSQPGDLGDIKVGSDGNVYLVVVGSCSSKNSELVGLDVADGSKIFGTPYSVTEDWNYQWLFAQDDQIVVKTAKELLFFDHNGTARASETITAAANHLIGNAFAMDDDGDIVYLTQTNSGVTPPSTCTSFGVDIKLFYKSGTAVPTELTLDDCDDVSDIEIKPNGKLVYVYKNYDSGGGWRLKQRSTSGTIDFDVSLTSLSGYSVSTADIYTTDTLTVNGNGGIYVKRQVTASPSGSLTDTDIRVDSFDNSGAATTIFNTSDLDDSGVKEVRAKMRTLGVAIAGGSLFVPYCMTACDETSTGYIVRVQETVGFDYPRSSAITAHLQLNYVALGDSFSSGEGVEPFITGTDTSTNKCHRSKKAYPRLLVDTPGSRLKLVNFMACSGATTGHINSSGQYGEPAQTSGLNSDTNVVTITIGGNDVGFEQAAVDCNEDLEVTNCLDALEEAYDNANSHAHKVKVQTILGQIMTAAPNAQIIVVGYPYILSTPGSANWCGWAFQAASQSEREKVEDLIDALNGALSLAAALADVNYVDARYMTDGHFPCLADPYINGVVLSNRPYSYHPTELGQEGYASLVRSAIDYS